MNQALSIQIRDNTMRVWLYVAILTAIIGIFGSLISYYFNWGLTGTGSFLLVAAIINFVAFFFSDTLVLKIARAVPLKKEQAPEVYDTVSRLCIKAGIPMPKIYMINDTVMNAFATGRNWNHSAIAITRGLIEKMKPEEFEAVIAHELSHIRNYDMRLMAMVSVLASFISIIADLYWTSNVMSAVSNKDKSGVTAIIGGVLAVFAPLSAFFIQMAISRKREYIADAGSAQLTNSPRSLASALRKISMDIRLPKHYSVSTAHLYFSTPSADSWIDRLFSTHPPIEERIALLEKIN